MPVSHGQGDNKEGKNKRFGWMREHRDLWKDLPSDGDDVTEEQSQKLRELGKRMVDEGVYGKANPVASRSWGIRRMIGIIRREEGIIWSSSSNQENSGD